MATTATKRAASERPSVLVAPSIKPGNRLPDFFVWSGRKDSAAASSAMSGGRVLETPDGRYIVVRGRLWRKSNPGLSAEDRQQFVHDLMDGRRGVKLAGNDEIARRQARTKVDAAKHALGERGPVWWTDGAPDLNRFLIRNTPYREWFEALPSPVSTD